MAFRAVLFDLGGVVFTGPMAAFAEYERRTGLPDGLIRRLNSTDPDTNAWARYERSEVDREGFVAAFEAQARAAGHDVDAQEVLAALEGDVRPEMVEALRRLRAAGLRVAAMTNNVAPLDVEHGAFAEVAALFEVILQSSVEGVRKPEPAFYAVALERLGVTAQDCVYLDDLGINLKPAREMGMTTLKVTDPAAALRELGDLTGVDLTGTTVLRGPGG
ncbi:MAG: HAD-IA family hydrolase [Actinomycetota bacterium]|nr:HAD-IA family hydrolase [Actinomycetota bacterium]